MVTLISTFRVASSSTPRHLVPLTHAARRYLATEARYDPTTVERESDQADICIVGGGPAGLSAAIRLKQLEAERGGEVRVVLLEKGAEVGESEELD
jgi:electron-transferring-flavoprotein dehydrogenase